MNDKELPKTNNHKESNNSDWRFCPVCGGKLPIIQNLNFCTVCGTDIKYIKDYKKLRPTYSSNLYKSPMQYSQYTAPTIPSIYYGPEKITDENLIDYTKHRLWGTMASIGLPMAAFLIMNGLVGGFLALIMFISYDLALNSYIISLISLFELLFLIFPLLYVGKYLKNPTLKNRLILLGFTTRSYDRKRILKEILIGFGFALVGVVAVTQVSVIVEVILEQVFGINIIHDSTGLSGEIIPPNLPSLIFFSVVVILVVSTSEEILFRGFMQKGLARNFGDNWGIILTALIFSLIHLLGIFLIALESLFFFIILFILNFIPFFTISLILGLLYHWRNENLIAVMITHGVYDVLTIVITYLLYVVL